MEDEVREDSELNWVDAVRARFAAIGGVDLPIPSRGEFATERSIFDDPAFDDVGLDDVGLDE
jgi:hypothetical protein